MLKCVKCEKEKRQTLRGEFRRHTQKKRSEKRSVTRKAERIFLLDFPRAFKYSTRITRFFFLRGKAREETVKARWKCGKLMEHWNA